MAAPPVTEMTSRGREIFRLVVESYIDSGQPVGSKLLASGHGVDLSPASIRSVLADLENLGLLAAPHTSAGRIPTETGLRLFVDGMMQVAEPTAEERAAIEQRLSRPGPIEQALETTSSILSDISAAAGVVMVPRREPMLSQLSLVRLSPDRALAVLVGEDGHVENRLLHIDPAVTGSMLEQAGNYVSAHLAGRTLAEAAQSIEHEIESGRAAIDAASADLISRGLALWSSDSTDRPVLIVRGQARLIDEGTAADLDRVRQLLDELEGKEEIARLLGRAREGAAMKIFIGSENELFALSGSSVIAAPYRGADGRVVGVVGVIGPTRLNYARVVPMVDFTAKTLSRLMA